MPEYRNFRSRASDQSTYMQVDVAEPDLAILAAKAIRALEYANSDNPWLCRTADGPVRLHHDARGQLVVEPLTESKLSFELSESVRFIRRSESNGAQTARPPRELARFVFAHLDLPFPILDQISHIPQFGPDGVLRATSGYDAALRVYFDLPPELKALNISPRPDDDEVQQCLGCFPKFFLGEFPFVGPPDRAHATAALLLPFVRPMITGPTPLHLLTKPTPRTGATLLTQVIGTIIGSPMTLLDECRSSDEWSRRILTALLASPWAVLLDNVSRLLSTSLAAAITAHPTPFSGRLVGSSQLGSAPAACCWFATGNNPQLSPELLSRSVPIELDARTDRPGKRTFRDRNLLSSTARRRPLLVWACLTLVQAWIAAGRPRGEEILGGFEDWAATMGGILRVAGVPGFLTNRDKHEREADTERPLRAFFGSWWQRHKDQPVSTAEILDLASALDHPNKSEQGRKVALGRLLGQHRGRCFDGLRLVDCGLSNNSQSWRLESFPPEAAHRPGE